MLTGFLYVFFRETSVSVCQFLDPKAWDIFPFLLRFLFVHLWLCEVFVATSGLRLVAESEGSSLLCGLGFSLQWLLLMQSVGSGHTGFSSRSTWVQ